MLRFGVSMMLESREDEWIKVDGWNRESGSGLGRADVAKGRTIPRTFL